MNTAGILMIALGLSLDAFAVSMASGLSLKHPKVTQALKMAVFFGLFQAVMPVVGWSIGSGLSGVFGNVDHWIAFGLLFFVGFRMIGEARSPELESGKTDPFRLRILLLLAVATSIDALAVGISFAFLKLPIAKPAVIIGAVTFTLSFCGVLIGHQAGRVTEKWVKLLGGLILIGIGIKILIDHLFGR